MPASTRFTPREKSLLLAASKARSGVARETLMMLVREFSQAADAALPRAD